METSVPALGTNEYTNYLVNKGKNLGLNLEQFRQPVSSNTAPIADATRVGEQLNIPTGTKQTQTSPELGRVGTTPIPKTNLDTAKEAILKSVPEKDRAQIESILGISANLQTERGSELESDFESLSKERLDLAQRRADRTREGLSLSEDQRIPELEAELESIRGESDVLSARRNSAIQAEAGRQGVSTQAQGANIQAIEKDFSLQQANLAIRELASVGKINAATRLIQTKLDIKYGDIEAETELVKAQIDAILPLLSREDAKIAETRLLLNEQVKSSIADAREKDKQLEETKLQVYLNAVQQGATPSTLSSIMSTDNLSDLLRVGGSYTQTTAEKLAEESARLGIQAQEAQLSNLLNTGLDAPVVKTINGVDMQWSGSEWVSIGKSEDNDMNATAQLDFLRETAKTAKDLANASGTSYIRKKIGDLFVGDTKFRQLEAQTNTLRTNVLTLMTDPSVKKYFGPQMSEADVRLMTAAGTTLNPENQSPTQLRTEITRLDNLFARMQSAVQSGKTTGTYPPGSAVEYQGKQYRVGADGDTLEPL